MVMDLLEVLAVAPAYDQDAPGPEQHKCKLHTRVRRFTGFVLIGLALITNSNR